jgi:hypothetical protein
MRSLLKIALCIPGVLLAQEEEGFHQHDGFFLSLNGGAAFGPIVLDATGAGYDKLEFSGPGVGLDLKIGGTIAKTLSLSFDVISRTISAPDIEMDGTEASSSDGVSANDMLMGLGVTYYIMPINILVSGTIGSSVFTLQVNDNNGNNVKAGSERGFGYQLKIGKEWWVGRNWGLGVSAGLGGSSADDKKDPNYPTYKGEISTSKLFVMFNTTYN